MTHSKQALRSVYLHVLADSIRKNGYSWMFMKLIKRMYKELIWALLLPFSIPMHLIGVRRLLIRIEHIGHLAAEPDCYIKEKRLNLNKSKNQLHFVLAPDHLVSNKHMLSYWLNHINIVRNKWVCSFIMLLTHRYFMRCDVSRYISSFFGTQDIYSINRSWGNRNPILELSESDEKWSVEQFSQLGILPNKKFVCIHVREGGYLPHNELIQSHRNASIINMLPSIKEMIKRGYVVVRMGDSTMSTLPEIEGLIDYAHHPLKSERMDVVLCAKASFFLGCTSGLSFVSMVFGVPVAQANMIPVEALAVRHCDVSIPKKLWNNKDQRYLTFNEILSSPIGGYYFTHQYSDEGIRVDENSPEDILALSREMLDRVEGEFSVTVEDEKLHSYYMSLFHEGHYSYGASSNICIDYLKAHSIYLA